MQEMSFGGHFWSEVREKYTERREVAVDVADPSKSPDR